MTEKHNQEQICAFLSIAEKRTMSEIVNGTHMRLCDVVFSLTQMELNGVIESGWFPFKDQQVRWYSIK